MKKHLYLSILCVSAACGIPAYSQGSANFTNFIRQVQLPTMVQRDVGVPPSGTRLSELAIDPGGARFTLWTVQSSPLRSILLSERYVGGYIPIAEVVIRSEDMAGTNVRTIAGRPFWVDVTIGGLLSGANDPVPSKSVKFLRHAQSYGLKGNGQALDRTQATLISQSSLATNGTTTFTYLFNSLPGDDTTKVRGEERFSIYSLADYQAPESQLASQTIQIWPQADGTISGIANNQKIGFVVPPVTITFNDIYPNSTIYAQVYPGRQVLGTVGTMIPEASYISTSQVPMDYMFVPADWAKYLVSDGRWTMEIVTDTPWGQTRLAYKEFEVDRTIEFNGNISTSE